MLAAGEPPRRRLNVQGFNDVDDDILADVGPWLRMAFGICALLAGAGTALASPMILWVLTAIAALAALFPVHPETYPKNCVAHLLPPRPAHVIGQHM